MWFAAKYYALSAAYVALNADSLKIKPLIAPNLFRAGECDYLGGAWHGLLELCEVGARIYPHHARDPKRDFNEPDGELQRLIYNLTALTTTTGRLHPALSQFAQEKCALIAKRVGLGEAWEQVLLVGEQEWSGISESKLWEAAQKQLGAAPWSDAGAMRQNSWRAHGVTWNFNWPNEHATTLIAEEFLAALQILLSDLAGQDLLLLRSTLHISIRLMAPDELPSSNSYKGFDFGFEPSNSDRRCLVTLPCAQTWQEGRLPLEDMSAGTLSVMMGLLSEVSLLSNEALHDVLAERFSEGLSHKLLIAAPYNRVLRQFIGQKEFDASNRLAHPPIEPPQPFVSELPDGLPWFDGPGPGYSTESAREILQNRYTNAVVPIQRTLAQLKTTPQFQETIAQLRAEGWLDWHILAAISSTAISYRFQHQRIVLPGLAVQQKVMQKIATEPESEDALAVPLNEFSIENLRMSMNMCAVSSLGLYGLLIHQGTPDFEAIKVFLSQRYNYWKDDIEHADVFAATPLGGETSGRD